MLTEGELEHGDEDFPVKWGTGEESHQTSTVVLEGSPR